VCVHDAERIMLAAARLRSAVLAALRSCQRVWTALAVDW
jgi:hypothetical protein